MLWQWKTLPYLWGLESRAAVGKVSVLWNQRLMPRKVQHLYGMLLQELQSNGRD